MPPPSPTRRGSAVAEAVVAFVLMALAAVLGTVAHQNVVGAGRWPAGLLMAVALGGCCAGSVRVACPVPVARWAALAGWLGVVLLVAQSPPGGDVLVPANARGYTWLVVGLLVVAVVLALPARPGRVRAPARG